MPRPEFAEAKARLEAYCAYQERCTSEVLEKLKVFDLQDDEIQALVLHLEQENYLNDARFARSYASGKFAIKSWGKIKIKSHLIAKKISAQHIEAGLKEIDYDAYYKRAETLAAKKNQELSIEKNPWNRKQKVMRYLAYKGYESGLIYEVLGDENE